MNRPILKVELIDKDKAEWSGVNDFVQRGSNRFLKRFYNYTIMNSPTFCICYECIIALLPECNEVTVVDCEYTGITPVGINFDTLANLISDVYHTEGFLGVGRLYLANKKF